MIYSTTKTTSSLRKNVIDARVAREYIRTLEQKAIGTTAHIACTRSI